MGRGLQRKALRAELLTNGVTEDELDTIVPLGKLESLYASKLSAAELENLRAKHTSVASASGAEPGLDEVAYRYGIWEALVASQSIDQAALKVLAPARAEAIRAYLVDQNGLDAARVSVAPKAVMVKPEKKETAATDSKDWVRCQLELGS